MTASAACAPRTAPTPRATKRDEAWFTDLYQENVDRAYVLALRITSNSALAEDAVAEAFLRAWRSRQSFKGRGAARSWLLSITKNCAFDIMRATKDECDVSEIPEPAATSGSLSSLLSEEHALRMHEAFRRLTPEQQQVISLRFFEELPHGEIARRMGRSANAVRGIQFRALNRMRGLLETTVERPN